MKIIEILKDRRFFPLVLLICLLSIPIIFSFALNYHFKFIDYSNLNMKDFKRLLDFEWLIIQNITERRMKWQVYFSLFFALAPACVILLGIIPKKIGTTHGKAMWATKKDIEELIFTPSMIFTFWKGKGIKEKLKRLFFPYKINYPMNNVNFTKGFLCGDFQETAKKYPCYQDNPLSMLIVAPPGAGKSAAIAIPNLLRIPTSCIVTDIKGELCDTTAGYRQQVLKNEIYIFNPFGTQREVIDENGNKTMQLVKDSNIKFNPLARKCVQHLDFPQKKQLVEQIANTIFVSENKSDEHWTNSAKNLFNFYALYDVCVKGESTFFNIARGMNRTYRDIYNSEKNPFWEQIVKKDNKGETLYNKDNSPQIDMEAEFEMIYYRQCSEQKFTDITLDENWDTTLTQEDLERIAKEKGVELLDITLTDMANKLSQMNENEFASIKSTFNRFMSVFTHKDVSETTNDMSFEYEDMRTRNITLYIKIAQTDIDTLAPLLRIVLESFAKNLMIKESKKESERIYLILDEFVRFGKMPFLLEMPALCRSYGIVPLYITQSYAQIKKYYGEDDLNILKGTTAFQILFKMNIYSDAEDIAKEIGQFTAEDRSYSTSQDQMIFGGTSSYSKSGRELVTAQDILNIPNDQVFLIVSGHKAKPIKLKAHYYFKNKDELAKLKYQYKEIEIQEEPKDKIDTPNTESNVESETKETPQDNSQENTTNTTETPINTTNKDKVEENIQFKLAPIEDIKNTYNKDKKDIVDIQIENGKEELQKMNNQIQEAKPFDKKAFINTNHTPEELAKQRAGTRTISTNQINTGAVS